MVMLDFPELRQTYEWDCGPKAVQAILAYYGLEVREELLMKYAKTSSKNGTSLSGMKKVLEKFGLKFNANQMSFAELKGYLRKKVPVLLDLQAWGEKKKNYSKDYRDSHWVVAMGYEGDKIFFEDPYVFERTYLNKEELMKRWHSKEGKKKILNCCIAVFGKKKFDSKKIVPMG